ncbi:hypothetical protein C8J57DRAFT_1267271 [Mycena rebaudengoi]|nr:hypothetical protein C8J57DRAFT_1267271 [Mycena rebaudengoi]
MRPWATTTVTLLLCSCLPAVILANTEIINFAVSESAAVALPPALKWPVLPARTPTTLAVRPAPLHTALDTVCQPVTNASCAHELWLALDLDDTPYSKFTLRLSYPASTPTDYLIQVLDPPAVAALFRLPAHGSSHTNTKRKYARIRAVDTGVRTPTAQPPQNPNAPPPAAEFILVLEPLYLGVLPASLTPFLLVALPVLALAACAVPRVNAYLEGYAARARREIGRDLKAE